MHPPADSMPRERAASKGSLWGLNFSMLNSPWSHLHTGPATHRVQHFSRSCTQRKDLFKNIISPPHLPIPTPTPPAKSLFPPPAEQCTEQRTKAKLAKNSICAFLSQVLTGISHLILKTTLISRKLISLFCRRGKEGSKKCTDLPIVMQLDQAKIGF